MKLQIAMVYVNDLDRMVTFYRDAFALSVVREESSAGYTVLDAGPTRFALHAIPPHIAATIHISTPPQPREDTPVKLIFACDDLAAACARVVEAGGHLLPERFAGARDCLDPEGNIVQLSQS